MTDVIDRAIAATEPAPEVPDPTPTKTIIVTLDTTKRQVAVQFPADLTMVELLDFITWTSNPVHGMWPMIHPPSPIVDVAGRPFQS